MLKVTTLFNFLLQVEESGCNVSCIFHLGVRRLKWLSPTGGWIPYSLKVGRNPFCALHHTVMPQKSSQKYGVERKMLLCPTFILYQINPAGVDFKMFKSWAQNHLCSMPSFNPQKGCVKAWRRA